MSDEDIYEEDIQDNKYLMCKLGAETFGIDISHVTDIIEVQKITAVPDLPEYVQGVINLRGRVIPIIDLRLRFAMDKRDYDDRTVITVVDIRGISIGFLVETATEVLDIPEKDIDPPPRFAGNGERENYISGLGKTGEEVTIILDMAKLVSGEELDILTRAAV